MAALPKTIAVLSLPRLGFSDFWGNALDVLGSLGIPLGRFTGAFWDQCLSRAMEQALETNAEYILTLDYDTLFARDDIIRLIQTAEENPHVDALAAMQVARSVNRPLFTILADSGDANLTEIDEEALAKDLIRVDTAHFGCTLIRTDALRELQKPWMTAHPGAAGDWGPDRTDPDIAFWRHWSEQGRSLYVAPRVAVGHLELMIRWPGPNLSILMQSPGEFKESGPPPERWT